MIESLKKELSASRLISAVVAATSAMGAALAVIINATQSYDSIKADLREMRMTIEHFHAEHDEMLLTIQRNSGYIDRHEKRLDVIEKYLDGKIKTDEN